MWPKNAKRSESKYVHICTETICHLTLRVIITYPDAELSNVTFSPNNVNSHYYNELLLHCEISSSHSSQNEDGWLSFGLICCVVWKKFTDVSELLGISIIRAIVLNFYQITWGNNPEDSNLSTTLFADLFFENPAHNIILLTYLTHFIYSVSVNDRRVLLHWRWKQICRKITLEPLMFSCMEQNITF